MARVTHRDASLVVLTSRDAGAQGTRVPLARGLPCVVGRASTARLRLNDDTVARRHLIVEHDGGWIVSDLGSDNGSFVGEVRAEPRHPLANGNVILLGRTSLRFEERESTHEYSPEHEAAILASYDDDGRWLVYADWLQENENPLGAHMVARAASHASLEPISHELEATWRHGLLTHAVIRAPLDALTPRRLDGLVHDLFASPASRLLRSLEVDIASFVFGPRGGNERAAVTQALEALCAISPKSLRRLRLGPLNQPLELAPAFDALARACPALAASKWSDVAWRPTRAWLEVTQVSPTLKSGLAPGNVALDPRREWHLEWGNAAVDVGFVVGGWRLVTSGSGERQLAPLVVSVNGKRDEAFLLRDGDVIDLSPVGRAVFRQA